MRGTKTIVLDQDIEYSEGGAYLTTNEITLMAPGIDRLHVYSAMRAHVLDALFSAAKRAVEIQGLSEARKQAEEEEEAETESAEITGKEFFNQIGLGLGADRFPQFVSYVKKTLTNAPKLARVGQGSTPITDETWERLQEAGGMDAVADIIGTFASFFSVSQTAEKRTGKGKQSTSSSDSKVASPSNTRTGSRSKS